MQELKRKENKRHFNRYTNKNDFGNCQSSGMREYSIPDKKSVWLVYEC